MKTEFDANVATVATTGEPVSLPIMGLTVNPDNPREGYDVENLIHRFRTYGFDPTQPLAIAEMDDGTMVAVRGNRRLTGAQWLHDNDPEEFKRIFPEGKIPCILYKGLSKEEIAILAIDHGKGHDRQSLNGFEKFLAVRVLYRSGSKTQSKIAEIMGCSRAQAQKYIALAKLPKYVRDEFKPVLLNKLDDTNLRSMDILTVAKYHASESKEKFAETWKAFVDGTHPENQVSKKPTKESESIDYSAIKDRINSFDSESFLSLVDTSDSEAFPVNVDARFKKFETFVELAKEKLKPVEFEKISKEAGI